MIRPLFSASFTFFIGLSGLAFALGVSPAAHADSFVLTCRTSPGFTTSIKRALEQEILASIDTAQFSDARARVSLHLVSIAGSGETISTDELLSGVEIHDSGDPTGLAFGLSGEVNMSATGSCLYTYRVVVNTRGVDASLGKRLSTRTNSLITITTPPYGRLKKGAPTPE